MVGYMMLFDVARGVPIALHEEGRRPRHMLRAGLVEQHPAALRPFGRRC